MDILVKNNLVDVSGDNGIPSKEILTTVLSNLTYYGYALSADAYKVLSNITDEGIKAWWPELEPTLKRLTGDDRKMDNFVVYKNFPAEVLNMSEAHYWFAQILMYWGLPNELFTEEEKSRASMLEKRTFKVLHLANSESKQNILNSLLKSAARWTTDQSDDVVQLIAEGYNVNMDISFKENMVAVASLLISMNKPVKIKSATDVMRLAVGLSDGDITLRTNTKFKKFNRKERRYLLGLLDGASALEEDFARDKNRWKKLMHHLHPGEYGKLFNNVKVAYDKLYNGEVKSFNSKVEAGLKAGDVNILDTLANRPGEFVRRLQALLQKFGLNVFEAFKQEKVLDRLTVSRLLKLKGYLSNINERKHRMFPPKGNWSKIQIVDNTVKINQLLRTNLIRIVEQKIAEKVSSVIPSVNLDDAVRHVKLQTSDSDVLPYGRGTVFTIPDNVKFIRTASYWKCGTPYSSWFDNGWLFFDKDWKEKGSCCWTEVKLGDGAVFSGDPTNSKDVEGRACQMIDLYPNKLLAMGIRYAVWNILCYSRIKFSEAEDVFAALQWGEEPEKGKLFEPSRCQLSFPLKGDSYTKYVAYVDLQERKLVYMDANLPSSTHTAQSNQKKIAEAMPAFLEYLDTLPSVYDVFAGLPRNSEGLPVVYTDETSPVISCEAYVFKPSNEQSKYKKFDVSKLIV